MTLFEMCEGDCYTADAYSLVIRFEPGENRGRDLRVVLDAFNDIGFDHCKTFSDRDKITT